METTIFILAAAGVLGWVAYRLVSTKRKTNIPAENVPIVPPEKPFVWKWDDRRPIGMIALSSYTEPYEVEKRNWKLGGQMQFSREALMAHAAECIKNLKDINAQGMVTWDLEGQEYPHAISYIGDPTLLPIVAPEMDALADEYFKIFTDAGLRTGICLRPDQFRRIGTWAYHYSVTDPFHNLLQKVQYAINRWGCSLFYVDSNVWPGFPDIENTVGRGDLMDPAIFQKLAEVFPDCLFLPEHQNAEYHKFSAPYNDRNYRYDVEPGYKTLVPGAFQCLAVIDDTFGQAQLNDSVGQGNILMPEVWYSNQQLARVKQAYANH